MRKPRMKTTTFADVQRWNRDFGHIVRATPVLGVLAVFRLPLKEIADLAEGNRAIVRAHAIRKLRKSNLVSKEQMTFMFEELKKENQGETRTTIHVDGSTHTVIEPHTSIYLFRSHAIRSGRRTLLAFSLAIPKTSRDEVVGDFVESINEAERHGCGKIQLGILVFFKCLIFAWAAFGLRLNDLFPNGRSAR